MQYQDWWGHGKLISAGYRECENRYETIRRFCCEKYEKGFSVCDIGANNCYFGIRLAEDFGCTVMAFEFHNFIGRQACVFSSGVSENIMLINYKVKLKDLKILANSCKFDLVLALSILHHITEDQYEWEKCLSKMAKNAIVEYAGSDSKRAKANIDFDPNTKGTIIGYGDSHLDKTKQRPIVVLRKDL